MSQQATLRQAIISLLCAEEDLDVILEKKMEARSKIAGAARQIRWAIKQAGCWKDNEAFQFICDGVLFEVDATDVDGWPTVRPLKVPKIDGGTSAMPFDENEGEG